LAGGGKWIVDLSPFFQQKKGGVLPPPKDNLTIFNYFL